MVRQMYSRKFPRCGVERVSSDKCSACELQFVGEFGYSRSVVVVVHDDLLCEEDISHVVYASQIIAKTPKRQS